MTPQSKREVHFKIIIIKQGSLNFELEIQGLTSPSMSTFIVFDQLLTWTKRGIQWRLLITALLWASRAKICSAPTHPSTMSSILTPSITTLCPGLLCMSWWARIISWTSCGRPPCSRIGVWLRGHNARLRMRPTTAFMRGQRDGG